MPATSPLRRYPSQTHNILGIDWTNPLAKGITFAAVPNGVGLRNLITGAFGKPSGSAPPMASVGEGGAAIRHAGGSTGASYTDFGQDPNVVDFASNNNPGSLFMWVRGDYITNNVGGLAARNDNNGSAGWLFYVSGGKLALTRVNSGTNGGITSTADFPQRVWTSVAATVKIGAPPLSGGANLYVGGIDAGGSANGGSGSNTTDAAQNLLIGDPRFGGAGSWGGQIEMCLFWNRVLTPQEIKSLHDNRFQLFYGRRRNVYFRASAGATILRRPVVMVM